MTKVGIVVATRDRPELLARALASIAAQEGLESAQVAVVVVDDAGDVEAAPVVDAFRASAPPHVASVTLVRNSHNLGRSASRMAGVARLEAPWLGFLDDDDLLHPSHVCVLLEAASSAAAPAATVAWAASERVVEDHAGAELERSLHDDGGELREDILLLRNLLPIQAALVPRALFLAVGGFDEALDVLEDWDLWLRLAPLASFVRVDQVTSEFRHRSGAADNSVTRERARHIVDIATVYDRHPIDPARPDAGALTALRERTIAAARAGLDDAWAFDRSVLALLPPSTAPSQLVDLLVALDSEQEALGGRWQLVLALPRGESLDAVLAGVEGDLEVLRYDAAAPPRDPLAMLRRHARGRALDTTHVPEGPEAA